MNYNIMKEKDGKAGYVLRVARSGGHIMGLCAICQNKKNDRIGHTIVKQLESVFEDMKKGNYYINDQVKKIVPRLDQNTELAIFTFLDDYCHKYTVGHGIDVTIFTQAEQEPMCDITIYDTDGIKCIFSSGKWCKDDILMITSNSDRALNEEIEAQLLSNNGNITNLSIHPNNTIVLYTRKE